MSSSGILGTYETILVILTPDQQPLPPTTIINQITIRPPPCDPNDPAPGEECICPEGQTGTPPNCIPEECPEGQTGTPPNCIPEECPEGQTGTPPNCIPEGGDNGGDGGDGGDNGGDGGDNGGDGGDGGEGIPSLFG
jgi:hypothetical protein